MVQNRRNFVKDMAAMGFVLPVATLPFTSMGAASSPYRYDEIEKAGGEDEFWKLIQASYQQDVTFTNLENGYFSPQPLPVLEAFIENTRMVNARPSFYMRRSQEEDRENVRKQLAAFAGIDPEELALTRNTTESLNIVIQGMPLQKGDEVIVTDQDYGSMLEAFAQRARREGIVVKEVAIPLHPQSDEEVVKVFEAAVTKKTRVLLVTHMINLTGQVLPVKKISEMAHAKGIEVMVDGAHTFAHLDFKITDLGCDYYAASLHKWLCCPLGAGMLWVKKDRIEKLWPLLGDNERPHTDIRKLEHQGTQPCAVQLTIPEAIKFHNLMGTERKQNRLRYLKNYWVKKLEGVKGVSFNTPGEDQRTGAIANVAVQGYTPTQLAQALWDKHKIFTVAIEKKAVNGVRITPHLYTTETELDKLVNAIIELTKP